MSPSRCRTGSGARLLRSGAAELARALSQYAKNTRFDGCFTYSPTRQVQTRDSFVPSPHVARPFSVVRKDQCSVHAEGRSGAGYARNCRVNVKLTTMLRPRGNRLVCIYSIRRRLLPRDAAGPNGKLKK